MNVTNKSMRYRICVAKDICKCTDTDGAWDGTWDEWFEYIIFNSDGEIVEQEGGFSSKEKAREAGEKKLKSLEDKL